MNKSFSIYLEIVRILATLIVFVAHSAPLFVPLETYDNVTHFGRDGVVIFFVLSGFVISWCANEREHKWTDYFINRASRIYSVALPALLLGFIVACLNAYINDTAYPYQLDKLWLYLPIYFSFIGNAWALSELPPANFPYWSLNYEVWYYIIFGAFFYLKGIWRIALVVLSFLIMGPDQWLLHPIWIAGSLLYYYRNTIDSALTKARARALFIVSIVALLAIRLFNLDNVVDQYNAVLLSSVLPEMYIPPQMLGDYLLGLFVLLNFACARNAEFTIKESTEQIVKTIASYSFSCYLFHIPIYHFIKYSIQPDTNSAAQWLASMMAALVVVVILAQFTEHKKTSYRNLFKYLFNRLDNNVAKEASQKV